MKFTYEGRVLLAVPEIGDSSKDTQCQGCVADKSELETDSKEWRARRKMCLDLPPCGNEDEQGAVIYVDDTPDNRVIYIAHMLTR